MNKQELLDAFDKLKASVAEFAKPSVAGPMTAATDPFTGRVYPDANPGETIEHGEESIVGHIHSLVDQAADWAKSLNGKSATSTTPPAAPAADK